MLINNILSLIMLRHFSVSNECVMNYNQTKNQTLIDLFKKKKKNYFIFL